MTPRQETAAAKKAYEYWHGEGSWASASKYRKEDWKRMVRELLTSYS